RLDRATDSLPTPLRLTGTDSRPGPVAGNTLRLAQRVTGLKLGEPLVLENGDTQRYVARLISGAAEQDGLSVVTADAPIDVSSERAPAPAPTSAVFGAPERGATVPDSLRLLGSGDRLPPAFLLGPVVPDFVPGPPS